jgi:hypothetical protein
MQYMLLIYVPHQPTTPEEREAAMPAWMAYSKELQDRKAYIAGSPLAEPTSATTVRAQNGKRTVTDGPFAETKEWLGGYYLLDCKSLDEAIELAGKCPAVNYGSIELRPVLDM